MATFNRFEDIEAWQIARDLARVAYQVSSRGALARDFRLRDQFRAAVISAMSNVAEGFERDGSNEFLQYLSIAKGSLGEARSQLYVARDQGFLSEDEFHRMISLAERASGAVAALMSYLRNSPIRGRKYAGRRSLRRQQPET